MVACLFFYGTGTLDLLYRSLLICFSNTQILRTFHIAKWDGLIIPDEWKHMYEGEGGGYMTRKEVAGAARRFVKDLGE